MIGTRCWCEIIEVSLAQEIVELCLKDIATLKHNRSIEKNVKPVTNTVISFRPLKPIE